MLRIHEKSISDINIKLYFPLNFFVDVIPSTNNEILSSISTKSLSSLVKVTESGFFDYQSHVKRYRVDEIHLNHNSKITDTHTVCGSICSKFKCVEILFNSKHFQINFLVGFVLSVCGSTNIWLVSLDWECRKCVIKRLLVLLNV